MPKKTIDGAELEIIFSPEAQAQIDADPEIANGLREVIARMRQAQQDFHDGKFASFEEAMRACGAVPLDELDGDEND